MNPYRLPARRVVRHPGLVRWGVTWWKKFYVRWLLDLHRAWGPLLDIAIRNARAQRRYERALRAYEESVAAGLIDRGEIRPLPPPRLILE